MFLRIRRQAELPQNITSLLTYWRKCLLGIFLDCWQGKIIHMVKRKGKWRRRSLGECLWSNLNIKQLCSPWREEIRIYREPKRKAGVIQSVPKCVCELGHSCLPLSRNHSLNQYLSQGGEKQQRLERPPYMIQLFYCQTLNSEPSQLCVLRNNYYVLWERKLLFSGD